jgi:hypothetical protein
MNRKSFTERPLVIVTVSSLIALGCVGTSVATSRAQTETTVAQNAPDSAALQRKVEALEKQVEQLKKQVDELKQKRTTFSLVKPTQPNLTIPLQRWQTLPAEPPPGTPFQFNGRTYYRSLLETQAQANINATVNLSAGGPLVFPARTSESATPAAGSK